MSIPPNAPIGPWPKGINNVNDVSMLPPGCLQSAMNVLLDSGGVATPREGYSFLSAGANSLFEFNGRHYGVLNNMVCEFTDVGARAMYGPITGTVTWTVLNNEPLFVSNAVLGRVSNDRVMLIGVEEPGAVYVSPGQHADALEFVGGIPAGIRKLGMFYMACSFVSEDGEEGPLSAAYAATSITVPLPLDSIIKRARVYQTNDEGDVLYELTETTPGATVAVDTTRERFGRQADTQYKSRMIGGAYARYWRGRLLVARGRTLYFSEPLRYGLYDRSSGHVTFEARIDFIEPVAGGIFVALKGLGVRFLAGDTPGKWEQRVATPVPAQPGTSMTVPAIQMKIEMQNPPDWVAVWFSTNGFVVGLPTGELYYPQEDHLSGLPLGSGAIFFEGDRLTVLSQ